MAEVDEVRLVNGMLGELNFTYTWRRAAISDRSGMERCAAFVLGRCRLNSGSRVERHADSLC